MVSLIYATSMDITLIRTFLEVAATGSFMHSADKLFVTQSAVSLRVKRLEDQLGHALFSRSKAGAELTTEGKAFEGYALSLVKLWEEARQQIGVPEGFDRTIAVGGQESLWPRLGFRWIDTMQARMPSLAVRAEMGPSDRLTRFLIEGVVQAALMHTPQLRPGLHAEPLLEEDLILVAGCAGASMTEVAERYVMIDWGPEFVQAHAVGLPNLVSGKTLALGSIAVPFVAHRGLAAYMPARSAMPFLESGELHLVADAPVFPYPAWVVWHEDLDTDIRAVAKAALDEVVATLDAAQEGVIEELAEISEEDVAVLGEREIPSNSINEAS